MKIYRVGGSVRDELIGLPVVDRDYVVVGATPESMIALGYQPVGRDFPVFLHPETHEEYALARTERKSGRGHQGFVFHADPGVTLEADLLRRDLTINAMARDDAGALIDPYGGQRDLMLRTLRHVSPAFGEDPLRVLRLARFAARFGFDVADETEALMRAIVARGELADLSIERVWREFALGLTARQPSRMLAALRRCGALREIAPELDQLYSMTAGGDQPDLGVVTALALDRGARAEAPAALRLPIQFGIATRNLGVGDAQSLLARLKVGNDCRDAALQSARHATAFGSASSAGAEEWLALLNGIDAQRRPERLDVLIAVAAAYAPNEIGGTVQKIAESAREALLVLGRIDYRDVGNGDRVNVADRVRELRLRALTKWLEARPDS